MRRQHRLGPLFDRTAVILTLSGIEPMDFFANVCFVFPPSGRQLILAFLAGSS